jgi:hypothetical protein
VATPQRGEESGSQCSGLFAHPISWDSSSIAAPPCSRVLLGERHEGTAPLGDKTHLFVAVYSGGFIAALVIGSSSQTLVIHPRQRHRPARGYATKCLVPPGAPCLLVLASALAPPARRAVPRLAAPISSRRMLRDALCCGEHVVEEMLLRGLWRPCMYRPDGQ